ncbi:dye decolorizing peroxidase [Pleurotus eryngii]|uniref:Dye decolorizing peroxidase n=1 Tax=Pleurotus eryngii TaxID=5323 RepID=A0A9P6DB87_PLEER|nr:dye decolorizing peroxidase [Pleurotus eryngii]
MRWSTFCITIASLVPYALVPIYGFTPPPHLQVRQTDNSNGSFLHDYPGQGPLPSLEVIQKLNATNGTFLPLDEVQGDILIGMKKPKQLFFFYSIRDPKKFKQVLAELIYPHITTTSQLICTTCPQPKALLNVAWTSKGLNKLNVFDNNLDPFFNMGQVPDANALGDNNPPQNWVPGLYMDKTDGVFLIASKDWAPIDSLLAQILSWLGSSIVEVHRLKGAHRTGAWEGHEHFGFLDGISQPAVAGFATGIFPGQSLILPGAILTGEIGDPLEFSRPGWMKWGSFLAFRQLQQFVPEFDNYLLHEASAIPDSSRTVQERADLLGARMIGRWKSGTPADLAPNFDIPSIGPDFNLNNNFDFNHPAPFNLAADQSFCPFSAHIRKIRPRADEGNNNFANQIMRAGIPYGDDVTDLEWENNATKYERGLAFVSYQSDIGSGYRFQQVSWANDVNFVGGKIDPTPGFDPIFGQNGAGPIFSSGIDYTDPNHDLTFMSFVLSRGGEYLYSPSMSAILNPIAA